MSHNGNRAGHLVPGALLFLSSLLIVWMEAKPNSRYRSLFVSSVGFGFSLLGAVLVCCGAEHVTLHAGFVFACLVMFSEMLGCVHRNSWRLALACSFAGNGLLFLIHASMQANEPNTAWAHWLLALACWVGAALELAAFFSPSSTLRRSFGLAAALSMSMQGLWFFFIALFFYDGEKYGEAGSGEFGVGGLGACFAVLAYVLVFVFLGLQSGCNRWWPLTTEKEETAGYSSVGIGLQDV